MTIAELNTLFPVFLGSSLERVDDTEKDSREDHFIIYVFIAEKVHQYYLCKGWQMGRKAPRAHVCELGKSVKFARYMIKK